MKKLLVASTALVAFAAVSSAQAADPIKLSVGGFMNQWVSYADNEDDNGAANYAEVATYSDAEIYFRGSTKLDNGLTVSVNMDLEASGNPDSQETGSAAGYGSGSFDDTFLQVSSDTLGSVKIGSTKGASYGLSHTHKDVGIGLSDGDWDEFALLAAIGEDDDTLTSSADGHKVVYLTPNLGGFQAGFSYGLIPQSVNNGHVDTLASTANDIQYNLGVAYNGEFSGVSVGADVNYEQWEDGGITGVGISNYETWRAGLSVGVAGFTFAGAYQDHKNVDTVTDKDGDAWEVGVTYKTGPYGVSLGYYNETIDENGNAGSTEDEKDVIVASGSYDLGAGVTFAGSIFHVETDRGSDVAVNSTNDNKNWGVAAGLKVAF